MSRILAAVTALTARLRVVAGDGTCVVVPKGGTNQNGERKFWCQVNCPVDSAVTDGHAICPFFDPAETEEACATQAFSAGTAASSCNQGFSGAACPPGDFGCIGCVRSEMQCSTCGSAALCSQSNGFSVSENGVTGDLGSCDHSDGELTTCEGREASPCGYICTGHCERGFSSSWNCDFEARSGQEQLVSRCERTTLDDADAECDLHSCDNGCMAAFLVQVEAGNASGWELSYPLGLTSGAAALDRASVTIPAIFASSAIVVTWWMGRRQP